MEIDFNAIEAIERYRFLTHAVVPRPIAWVTTVDAEGTPNAAPFSFFNVFGSSPAIVALGIGKRSDGSDKDTLRNILSGGEFVINMVTEALAESMVATSAEFPPGTSELEAVGLTTRASGAVVPPRIAECPVHLECRLHSTQEIGRNRLVLGEVVHGAVDDAYFDSETKKIVTEQIHPVGRMHGPAGYTRTRDGFEIERPSGLA